MLVTSIFSFSHNVYYYISKLDLFFFLVQSILSFAYAFDLDWSTVLSFSEGFLFINELWPGKSGFSKLKEFTDDNFKLDENGRKLSKQVKNTVGKREIARYEQFLLFPQCFEKACFPGASKGVVVWEWVKA